MASEFDEFSGSLSCKVVSFDPSVIRDLEYTHLLIHMGDEKPSEEFRRLYPTIRTIVFEAHGKRYEYDADQFLALLDWWKDYGHKLADARAEGGMNATDELRPCPFCGGEAKAYQHGDVGFVVQCRRCGIWNAGYAPAWSHVTEDEFHGFVTEADAIAAWNGRAENEWVKVVRCRDCKHVHHEHDRYSCCRLTEPGEISVEPFGFCAWGERKVVDR